MGRRREGEEACEAQGMVTDETCLKMTVPALKSSHHIIETRVYSLQADLTNQVYYSSSSGVTHYTSAICAYISKKTQTHALIITLMSNYSHFHMIFRIQVPRSCHRQ